MFDNEKHYQKQQEHSDSSVETSSKVGPPTKQFVPESPSMPKIEDPVTPTSTTNAVFGGHDNSITSDPSEATTTISDDATVVSLVEPSATTPTATIADNNAVAATPESTVESPTATHQTETVEVSTTVQAEIPVEVPVELTPPERSPVSQNIPEIIEPTLEPSTSTTVPNQSDVLRVDATEVYQIIDSIRQTTSLSHKMACVALQVILAELETIYSTRILHLLEPIAIHLAAPLQAPDEFVEHTVDSQRLKVIFAKLSDCKNDAEQRAWMLHEDEEYIMRFLTHLNEVLVSIIRR